MERYNPRDRAPTAVTYARVAVDDGQRSWDLVERQQQQCRAAATRIGAHVVAEFVDLGQSGTRSNRPGMNSLLAHVEDRQIDYLAVTSLDRLARSTDVLSYVLTRLREHDVNVLQADSDSALQVLLLSDLEQIHGACHD